MNAAASNSPIVLTGAGAVTPIGVDRQLFAATLALLTAARERGAPSLLNTAVEGVDPKSLPEPKSFRRAARHVLFGVAAAAEALREADASRAAPTAPEESALVFASALGSANFSYELWRQLLASGPLGASPVLFSEGVPNALAGHVAHALRLLGPGHMLGGGSDAGLRALAIGRDLLDGGRAKRVVVGAAEELCELATRAYRRMRVKLAIAEGAAAFVVERADGERPRAALAELLAIESVQLDLAKPSRARAADSLVELVRAALDQAHVAPRDLAWIGRASNGTAVDAVDGRLVERLRDDGCRASLSDAVRRAAGDAFTVTPLLQVVEALPIVAERGPALVVSISQFGATSALVLGPPPR
jgi:3-oxoacyl-[acyl-carrier-protein] synthase II